MKRTLPTCLYIPNLVGYLRLFLLFYGLWIVKEYPIAAGICFISNLLLDAVDGFLARWLKQTSAFGGMLDYTTDRISLASYAIVLSTVYPDGLFFFCLIINLDLISHFFHISSTLVQQKLSHKEISGKESAILRFYYKKVVLGITCLTRDLFFILLYLYSLFPHPLLEYLLWITLIGVLFKAVIDLIQIWKASLALLASKVD